MPSLDLFADRWPEISELLDQALELPIAEHERWLEQLDRTAPGLRARLQDLLSRHAGVSTRNWLETLPSLDRTDRHR